MIPERRKRALKMLNENKGSREYTPPAPVHYPHRYYWDSMFISIIRSRFDDFQGGAQEIKSVLKSQDITGFIPNMVFDPKGRIWDPERRTFTTPEHSDYTQPPLVALAAKENYDSFLRNGKKDEGRAFLESIYPGLRMTYIYFSVFRENGRDNLVANIHPHETGRDADPTWDHWKLRLSLCCRDKPKAVRLLNSVLDYFSTLNLNMKLKGVNWNIKKAKNIFWVYDVMFNCIYAHNLRIMSEIAEVLDLKSDSETLIGQAGEVENQILDKMWNQKDQMFYALNRGKRLKTVSVSNLFPLILPNLPKDKTERMLDLLEDPEWFFAPYPIPSVPRNSKEYDPGYEEPRIWRGPTWDNTNWYLVRHGLLPKAYKYSQNFPELSKRCLSIARHISEKSAASSQKGYYECRNPETGEPLRTGTVRNFGWATLADDMAEAVDEIDKELSKM